MSNTILRCLTLAFVAGSMLHAQVDTRLQKCTTDVLDVYFGSSAQGAKPEIVTLIDNSGSMEALAWDARYYANLTASFHKDPNGGGENNVTYLKIVKSGSSTSTKVTATLGNWSGGLLIKPDGTPVTYSDVSSTDANDWVQQASHVRFAATSLSSATYTYGGTTYTVPNTGIYPKAFSTSTGAYATTGGAVQTSDKVRVVDIPLPWAVFDRVATYEQRTLSPDPTGMSTARSKKHPQHTYMYDPVPDRVTGLATSAAQWYELDTYWQATNGQGGLNGTIVASSGGNLDFIRYHYDYIWWIMFGQDVKNVDEAGAYQSGQVDVYSGSNAGGYTVPDVREGGDAFVKNGNALPAMTRLQAIKYAIIKTYIAEQLNVWWAIRFLNQCASSGGYQENGRSSATGCFNSSNTKGNPGDRMLLRLFRPTSANNPDTNMLYIQRMNAPNNTPLTFGLLNCYAQLASTDNGTSGSVFYTSNDPYKGDSVIPSCRRSFVVVMSDGNPNDDSSDCSNGTGSALGTGDPYSSGSMSTAITYNTIAPTKTNFNIYTLAGVAAHSSSSSTTTGWPTDADNAGVKPPFRITARPSGVTRYVETMTIGVSMVGTRYEAGAKRNMYKTALYGWKDRGTYNATTLPKPYDPAKTGCADKTVNPFFFDAQSPDAIADALALAFSLGKEATNTMSAPVSPLVGLDVGSQIYLGTFSTEKTGQPVWSGDLLMTGMKTSGSTRVITDANGNATDTVDKDSAVWSAYKMLLDKGWKNRSIYTLKPVLSGTTPTGAYTTTMLAFNENTSISDLPNSVMGVSTSATRQSLIRFMLGASLDAQNDTATVTSITTNRETIAEGKMMGDIINSTPAVLEFPMSKVPAGRLTTFVNAHSDMTLRFRVLIVGDNQGILHAFGEVSGVDTNDGNLVKGEVDELWGFIPPDILGGIDGWRGGATHRYLMDGTPRIYLYEKANTENGIVDGSDVVRVLVGMGKAGRSYYCLTFDGLDPVKPKMAWTIRPDDSSDATIKTMGFSTSMPAVARVLVSGAVKDVFLIGGGLSTTAVDAAFAADSAYGIGTKLGRSVLAFNTYNGNLLQKWDFINTSTLKTQAPNMGSIPGEVVPVEILSGSNKTQRVYFTDMSGSAYVFGAKASSGWRSDTSEMTSWNLRWLYNGKNDGTAISSAPAVFTLPYGYPVVRTTAPTAVVPAVGVVFGTGDRNDPMDNDTINPAGGGTTTRNRLVTLIDRQDSADVTVSAGGSVDASGNTTADLVDLTTVASTSDSKIDSSNTNYYLKSKNGYYLNFDVGVLKPNSSSAWFYKKVINPAIVLNSALYFTTFMPNTSSDVCSGSGTSYTYKMCDVLAPVYNSGGTAASSSSCSGWIYRFSDIPSRLGNVGLSGILQAGEKYSDSIDSTGASTAVQVSYSGTGASTNMTRPRAWRIVR